MKASAKEAFYESKIEDLFADAAVVPAFDARRLATDPHKDQWPVVELRWTSFYLQAVVAMVCFATMVSSGHQGSGPKGRGHTQLPYRTVY